MGGNPVNASVFSAGFAKWEKEDPVSLLFCSRVLYPRPAVLLSYFLLDFLSSTSSPPTLFSPIFHLVSSFSFVMWLKRWIIPVSTILWVLTKPHVHWANSHYLENSALPGHAQVDHLFNQQRNPFEQIDLRHASYSKSFFLRGHLSVYICIPVEDRPQTLKFRVILSEANEIKLI